MDIMTYEGFKALHADAARKAAGQPEADSNAARTVRDQIDKGLMPWWGDLVVTVLSDDHKNN